VFPLLAVKYSGQFFNIRPAGAANGILKTSILKNIFHFERFGGVWRLTDMRFFAIIIAVLVTCLGDFTSRAAHTEAQLLLSADTAKAGDTVLAGVRLTMQPGWHTYWKNPGAAGKATEIKWQLPPGVTAGEIQWPVPEKMPPLEVTTYAYEKEVVLLVPLKLEANLPPGTLNLAAKVSWLECNESCIPAGADVQAALVIGPETKVSANDATLATWQARVPAANAPFKAQVHWQGPASGDDRLLLFALDWSAPSEAATHKTADFFPTANDAFEIEAEVTNVLNTTGAAAFTKPMKKFSGDWPKEVSGLIVLEDKAYELTIPITDTPAVAPGGTVTTASATTPLVSLWQMLLYAFIGGLILNIMPCVLPVIALKILGFVSEAKSSPRRVRALGGIYAIGVLFSFLILAGVVIGIKAAGHQAGWGMQFANPTFIVCLTTLVTLVALNLFGVFEVTLGGGVLDKAGELASKQGAAGAFFNGMLATALATPCTAPILGSALGFAFAQSAPVILVMFLTVGLGLAAPYVLLSWNPAWLKFLPKPGAWMEKFKVAIGFPVLGTAVWLFTLASGVLPKSQWLWFGLFLISLALAAWIWGEFFQRGTRHRGAAMILSLLLAGGFGAYAYGVRPDQIDWHPWSPEVVAKAQAGGKPVLVDFTADWCLTCQVNKKTSIETAAVQKKIADLGVVALAGDYTLTPDNITTELTRYGRAGVPLVLVFPKNADRPAIVLPEVLTPGIVLDALERAAK
jgi:thiol:disulfide interchange protein DsbD